MRVRGLVTLASLILLAPCGLWAAGWGVVADFADQDPAVAAREAPLLAKQGVDFAILSMRGQKYTWFTWVKVQEAFDKAGIETVWDLPATVAECEHILGFQPGTLESPMSSGSGDQPQPRSLGFFSEDFRKIARNVTSTMAIRLSTASGYRFDIGGYLNIDGGADRLASWQAFLKRFFADDSPDKDTNGDTATFDKSYGASYTSWSQVPLFELPFRDKDERESMLRRLWLADAGGAYDDQMFAMLYPLSRKRLSGPEVSSLADGASDASVLAARKHVDRLYARQLPYHIEGFSSAAAAYGKPITGLVPDYSDEGLLWNDTLRALPYCDSICFKYNAVKTTSTIMLELAPFIGKLQVTRPPVLWIVDRRAPQFIDAYCVTETQLALDPESIDFSRFKVIVYSTTTPCASTRILQRLFEYALAGGVVLLDACNIGRGPTLIGRDNDRFWWEGMTLVRPPFGQGKTKATLNDRTWEFDSVGPYLSPESDKLEKAGEVRSTAGDYPLLLVKRLGKAGKWVYINVSNLWRETPMVQEIIRQQAGMDVPSPKAMRLFTGPACALAIPGNGPNELPVGELWPKSLMFDVATKTAQVPDSPKLTLSGSAPKLWVIKPIDKPAVLYSGGTPGHPASIEDGKLADDTLTFTFADRAWVVCPTKPLSVIVDGREAEFSYDSDTRVLMLEHAGLGEAEVRCARKS